MLILLHTHLLARIRLKLAASMNLAFLGLLRPVDAGAVRDSYRAHFLALCRPDLRYALFDLERAHEKRTKTLAVPSCHGRAIC